MQTFRLERVLDVPRSRDEVFPFFADARNLGVITPPWMNFRIVTPTPITMAVGTLIDYRLRVHGIPMKWRSEITVWDPPHRFVDEQRIGPYRKWVHEHRFDEVDGATRIHDNVDYAVPGGTLVHKLFVLPQLERIFAYRTEFMREHFGVA